MSEKYQVFEFAELDTVSFECPSCKTEILFRLDTPTLYGAPYVCPTCHGAYADLGNWLAAYRDLFSRARGIGDTIRLRLRSILPE